MNSYSQDLRDKVIALYKTKTHTLLELSELFSVGYSTIRRWCREYKVTGACIINKPLREGRKRLFDDKEAILKYLELTPDADGKELRNALAPHVTQNCFYNTLNRLGITYKKRGKVQKALRTKES